MRIADEPLRTTEGSGQPCATRGHRGCRNASRRARLVDPRLIEFVRQRSGAVNPRSAELRPIARMHA